MRQAVTEILHKVEDVTPESLCGCGDPLSAHAPKPAHYPDHALSGPCRVDECACTAFTVEMDASAERAVILDAVRGYILPPTPEPPSIREIIEMTGGGGSRSENGAEAPVDGEPKPKRDEEAQTKKYGPLREIKRVITKGRTSNLVEYECGHTGSVGGRAKRGRCKKCRAGAPPVVETVEAAPKRSRTAVVDDPAPVETPRKRTAVGEVPERGEKKTKRTKRESAPSKKRTPKPAKPAKRGKKGRR